MKQLVSEKLFSAVIPTSNHFLGQALNIGQMSQQEHVIAAWRSHDSTEFGSVDVATQPKSEDSSRVSEFGSNRKRRPTIPWPTSSQDKDNPSALMKIWIKQKSRN